MWMLQPKTSFLACQKMTLTIHEAIFYYKKTALGQSLILQKFALGLRIRSLLTGTGSDQKGPDPQPWFKQTIGIMCPVSILYKKYISYNLLFTSLCISTASPGWTCWYFMNQLGW